MIIFRGMLIKLIIGILAVCVVGGLFFLFGPFHFQNHERPVAAEPLEENATESGPDKNFPITYKITWERGPDAPIATMEGPCIQVGNQLFVMGGFVHSLRTSRESKVLDLVTMKWTAIPPLPQSQSHVGIATDGESLYFAGGQLGDFLSKDIRSEVFRFDIAAKTYTKLDPLPEPRLAGGMLYLNGYLHYLGGDLTDRLTVSPKHWAYHVADDGRWTERAPLISPGDHVGVCALNGKIYAVGGEHGHSVSANQHDAVSEYDPQRNTWRSRAPLPEPGSHFETAVLAVHNRIVAIGGMARKGRFTAAVRIYDPVSDSWQHGTSLPMQVLGGVAAFHNNRLYYVAGRANVKGKKRIVPYVWIGTIENPWW